MSMTPQINLNEQPEGEATDVSRHDEATTKATFNALPAELRVKIYAMTWEPRRVILTRSWLDGPEDLVEYEFYARTEDQNVYDFFNEDDVTTVSTSTAPLPVTLWINKESRHETLRNYEIAFACPRNGSSEIYFNFQIDELEIRRHGKHHSSPRLLFLKTLQDVSFGTRSRQLTHSRLIEKYHQQRGTCQS